MRHALLALTVLSTGCLDACPTGEDTGAKERIFSPEEPRPEVQAAQESIDAGLLADDAEVRRRVLRMSAAETRHRLGSFRGETQVRFHWKRGEREVELQETAVLEQAPAGDFRVVVENDQDFGLELRWVGGIVVAKTRHGQFFERRTDRAGHLQWRERSLEQLGTFLDLSRGRVVLARGGHGTYKGRPVIRYTVRTGLEEDASLARPPPPEWAHEPIYPKDGPDTSLLQRLAVRERGRPASLGGEIHVDEATGVVLRLELRGLFEVPAPEGEGGEAAILQLRITRDVAEVGAERTIDMPEHRPFTDRPRAVKDPLAWWPKATDRDGAKDAKAP